MRCGSREHLANGCGLVQATCAGALQNNPAGRVFEKTSKTVFVPSGGGDAGPGRTPSLERAPHLQHRSACKIANVVPREILNHQDAVWCCMRPNFYSWSDKLMRVGRWFRSGCRLHRIVMMSTLWAKSSNSLLYFSSRMFPDLFHLYLYMCSHTAKCGLRSRFYYMCPHTAMYVLILPHV